MRWNQYRQQPDLVATLGTQRCLDSLLQMLEPKRHVALNAVDKKCRGRSRSAPGAAVDVLLHALQVDVITHLVIVALQIELRRFRAPSNALCVQMPLIFE